MKGAIISHKFNLMAAIANMLMVHEPMPEVEGIIKRPKQRHGWSSPGTHQRKRRKLALPSRLQNRSGR